MSTPVPNPNTNPDPSKVVSVKIFPPIGIARLGDSGFDLDKGVIDGEITYFIPSEIPGVEDAPASGFRDEKGRIKRQAVRFRVYAYDSDGKNLGEITHDEKYQLTWTVHVANAKGSFHEFRGMYDSKTSLRNPDVQGGLEPDNRTQLIVDSSEKSISSIDKKSVDLTGQFQGSKKTGVEVGLGQLRTDDKGRLVFISAPGYSRSIADPTKPQPDIISEFDSIDWVDDTCDGWVDVKVEFKAAQPKNWAPKEKATIISAPPKFAWGMTAPTSLYDLIENIYWVEEGRKFNRKTEFYQDIWPVLRGASLLSWTNEKAAKGHGPGGPRNFLPLETRLKDRQELGLRTSIFNRLRKPNYRDPDQATDEFMPRLSGDSGDKPEPKPENGDKPGNGENEDIKIDIKRFAALTELQYKRFERWLQSEFSSDPAPWDQYKKLEDVPKESQPLFLTRAALEHTIGEPLYPGIEAYWRVKEKETYNIPSDPHRSDQDHSDPPFRINHAVIKPGHLGRGLSLPWQSDFDLCNTHWWPSIRPDDVFKKDDWGMQKKIPVNVFISQNFNEKHIKWDHIMRNPSTSTGPYSEITNMVRFWRRLGFVSKHKDYAITQGGLEMPVWLEDEELPHPEQSAV